MSVLRRNIAAMSGYVPGFQPEDAHNWIKLNTNENPYPPSAQVVAAIRRELGDDGASLRHYPDAASRAARRTAAQVYGFDPQWVIMANGSDELLNNLIRACADPGDEVAFIEPSYSYYRTLIEIQGARVRTFSLAEDYTIADFPARYGGKLFFLTSPHAPFGTAFDNAVIADLAQRCDGLLVVDEAYADFADHNALELVKQCPNVVVTRTLSKSYALAGMRLGLALARPEIVAALDKIRDHYHLDRLALVAAQAALADQDYLQRRVEQVRATRSRFVAALQKLGFSVPPSQTNFVFAIPADGNGAEVYELLKRRKILVRYFSAANLCHGVRISIGTDAEMDAVVAALCAGAGR